MAKILLLEDDEMLSQTIAGALKIEGYDVTCAKNGEEAADITYDSRFDLYLFDVNVPFMNGFDLLSELRNSGDRTPAFFVTALNDIDSMSQGFDAGCDDYIKKPFDLDELLIRVGGTLKRRASGLTYKEVTFDPETGQLLQNGEEVDLQNVEKAIFKLLIERLGQTVTKEAFYDVMEKPSDVALRVHIAALKKRFGLELTNIRGVGYRLERP
ncbi:MAG: response regulator transcription factor [Sulfurimonadaceae bacterium]|nr:response regulator transcription factor [Sulfurimonadaceae bacterium]